MVYEVNTISWWEKVFVTFIENCIRNDYVYLLNGKDEAIEMSRQCNIEVENQREKNIRSDKNGEYKSHCAEICLESEISNYCHIHLNLMKNRTLKKTMDALFISSGLHKTCVEELSLLQKGSTKSFVLLERKRFCLIKNTIFSI